MGVDIPAAAEAPLKIKRKCVTLTRDAWHLAALDPGLWYRAVPAVQPSV